MKNFIALSLTTICLLASCKDSEKTPHTQEQITYEESSETPKNEASTSNDAHKIVVTEKIATGGYIYLKVVEDEKEYWMSIPDRDIEIGATYYYNGGMVMKNFESKTLNRTFENVIFAEGIHKDKNGVKGNQKKKAQTGAPSVDSVEKAANGIRIAELFETPQAYANKEVIIKGEVVKVNNGIMQVNFVHLQDGSIGNGQYDITITTNDEFKIGEVATIKGTVILNKDFGAGYLYDVLVEKAVKL
ncbi:DNA-binding protein [Tamlana haliotis]|uniref:DNA-binding protein n=1 Tax=Pseudotamlana haliotis TaxID=2614804 RepID=A0A6N6MKX3_9FLAO|nr:DNA-binding protein [Tamlana haliotis]KAB1071903.1 DNA-binding protein [Tamlana haliotis]